ncbi:MAG: hypothetical protein DRJ67_10845, partial [Thermoprotei archaeon]
IRLIIGTVATLPGPKALRYLDEVERECIEFLKSLGFTEDEIEEMVKEYGRNIEPVDTEYQRQIS